MKETEEGWSSLPHEHTTRQLSANQEDGSHQTPALPAPWPWTSQPPELSAVWVTLSLALCLDHPSSQGQTSETGTEVYSHTDLSPLCHRTAFSRNSPSFLQLLPSSSLAHTRVHAPPHRPLTWKAVTTEPGRPSRDLCIFSITLNTCVHGHSPFPFHKLIRPFFFFF